MYFALQLPFSRTASRQAPPISRLRQYSLCRTPVDWWFVFKFNAANFPGCKKNVARVCRFGGQPASYYSAFGQQFVYASSEYRTFQEGNDCLGETDADPVGATFDQIYNDQLKYVVWNDQFYDDLLIQGCTAFCASPWCTRRVLWLGTTPVTALSCRIQPPHGGLRQQTLSLETDGNTLGCVKDIDVEANQHFFGLAFPARYRAIAYRRRQLQRRYRHHESASGAKRWPY